MADRAHVLAALRRRILDIEDHPVSFAPLAEEGQEGGATAGVSARVLARVPGGMRDAANIPAAGFPRWSFGVDAVDALLPNRALQFAALHDVVAAEHDDGPAAAGFALALVARLLDARAGAAAGGAMALYCLSEARAREFGVLYGRGLKGLGLDPDRFILASARHDKDLLWALEEGLREPSLAAVIADLPGLTLTESRRLRLAARESGVAGVIVKPASAPVASAAHSRWRVAGAASGPHSAYSLADDPRANDSRVPGRATWSVTLEAVRGAKPPGWRPTDWILDFDHDAHSFHMAAPLADRSPEEGDEEVTREVRAQVVAFGQ